MKFKDFEAVMSPERMSRYVAATGGNTSKAMTLYRKNLKLSNEMFILISCFEVALRNQIDSHYKAQMGPDWLRDSISPSGIFTSPSCRHAHKVISNGLSRIGPKYTHPKLVAEMDFGFWRYLFAQPQFLAARQTLLRIFPGKPSSTKLVQYNHTYVFAHLAKINHTRNRVAHHEPICFLPGKPIKDSSFARQHYLLVQQQFNWMRIDPGALLYGLDRILKTCSEIDSL